MTHSSFIARLKACVGDAYVISTPAEMRGYTEDFRNRYQADAVCVVMPNSTEQVANIVTMCSEHDVPVLPQGGNTSLCGGSIPHASGARPVILSLSRMRRIRAIDAINSSMIVDAGCILKTVQDAAAQVGRLYPVSLGAEGSCQIGGTLSTNAGGTSVLRYGNTRDNVLGLEVVLADGAIWNGLRGLRKDNTGIDLKQLFIGAEGVLGIITGATLKLHPLPVDHALAWFAPVDPDAALKVLGMFQASAGARMSAFELMNLRQVELVVENVHDRRAPLSDAYAWQVLVELSDSTADSGLNAILQATLEQAVEAGLIVDAVLAANDTQRATLWEVRHSVTEANKKYGMGLTTDCAVPVSAVPAFIEQATRDIKATSADAEIVIVGHMGDGNIHFIPMFSHAVWAGVADPDTFGPKLRHIVNDVAHRLVGTFSAEHGVGESGLSEMAYYKSPIELAMMRAVKQALDPKNLMNPGRLIPE